MSGESNTPSGFPARTPTQLELERRRTHILANLRQSVWEASQFETHDEIRQYVESVLREIESDEP